MKYARGILGILEGAFAALILWYTDSKRQKMKRSSVAKAIAQGEGIHLHLREPQAVIDEREARDAMRKARQKAREEGKPEGVPPKFSLKAIPGLLKDTFAQWNEDKAPQLAAALAYYTVFSMAPLLVIVIAVVGLVFGQGEARRQIVDQIRRSSDQQTSEMIETMLDSANKPDAGVLATVIGVVTLAAGAAGAMGQMKAALNTIWNVPPHKGPGGIKGILVSLKNQFISFGMVLGIGFLLLVSTLLSAGISAASEGVLKDQPTWLMEGVNFLISFGVITLLFAAIYKVLPDAEIKWRDVWIGAALTSLLFVIGKLLIGLYIGHSSTASAYGAAGSLIVILLWIYYSAQILFLGAEFTQVYANQYGSRLAYEGAPAAQKETVETGQRSKPVAAGRRAAW
jgi:membrane protein